MMKERSRRHFRYLSERERKRRGAAQAHICRGLRDCAPAETRSIARAILALCRQALKVNPVSTGKMRLIVRRRCRATGEVTLKSSASPLKQDQRHVVRSRLLASEGTPEPQVSR